MLNVKKIPSDFLVTRLLVILVLYNLEIMTIGKFTVHRASSIKHKLDLHMAKYPHQTDPEQLRYFNNLAGIHAARLFGLVMYRNSELI